MSDRPWRRVFLVLGAAFLLGGYGMSAASNGGLDVYSGGIDMHSTSISNLADPSSAQDAATRSWVNTNDDYEADTNTDASTTCSGADYLAGDSTCNSVDSQVTDNWINEGGDTMNGILTMSGGDIDFTNGNDIDLNGGSVFDTNEITTEHSSDLLIEFSYANDLVLKDDASTPEGCVISGGTGDLTCDGTKSWVHNLNSTHEIVYNSQESGSVRAVYEGKSQVENRTKIELPSHFSKTVSDTEPKLRATATVQGELAYAAVIEKTDDYIVLDSSEPATVNYRVTGIREGYEDKQVVRKKEE